jgi:hypothetical protein
MDFQIGDRVMTTEDDGGDDWTTDASRDRAEHWGKMGSIIIEHDSHGLCYEVLFPSGHIASYNPEELRKVNKGDTESYKVIEILNGLTPEERVTLIGDVKEKFCLFCGGPSGCYCMNDE